MNPLLVLWFHGLGKLNGVRQDSEEDLYFIEISSCHERARLHRTYEMSMAEWVDQVTKLRDHLNKYLEFLSEDRV